MHGGTNPGAPRGNQHATKHGIYSAEMMEIRREMARMQRQWRELKRQI